ncbi:MAG: class I SAM-dependent methyltransferase, partial [Pseudomonadota bacterium]
MPDTVDLSATEDQVSLPQPSAKCPCCGSEAKREVIYRVNSIPIQSCVLLDRYEDAISYEKRDLELAYCTACGFIHNQIFDATIVEYAAVTEESQHYSGTFSGFAKRLAKEIAETYPLDGKHVLEIGCGKGDFLIELCALADCTGLGIDPGFSHTRLNATEFAQGYDTDRIKFISDYFDTSYLHLKADLIMCRHTLEHIPDVATFVGNIRESIGNCQGTGVFFETPDAERVLAEGAFWDIYYEHCSYFTSASHAGVFKHNGFNVDAIRLDYDAQYIIHYSSPAAQNSGSLNSAFGNLDSIQQLVDAFPAKVA